MKKTIWIILALLIVQGAVFAEGGLAIGVSGALYLDSKISASDFFDRMQNGDGVFYGGLIEYGADRLALGLAGNFSFYKYEFFPGFSFDMVDYDINLYVQGHLLPYKSVLDPFGEAGLGIMASDFADEADDPDTSNPVLMTPFFHVGAGINLNIGSIGIFFKGLYLFRINNPDLNTVTFTDEFGNDIEYQLDEYPLKNFKLLLGAKLIL